MILEERLNLIIGNIEVIRFTNEEIENDIEQVITEIVRICTKRKSTNLKYASHERLFTISFI